MDDEEWRKQALAAETARVEKLHLETKAAMEEMAISDDEIEMLVSRFENDEGELDIDLLHQKVQQLLKNKRDSAPNSAAAAARRRNEEAAAKAAEEKQIIEESVKSFHDRNEGAIDDAFDRMEKPVSLIDRCGNMKLKKKHKEELSKWLASGELDTLSVFDRIPIMIAAREASEKLEAACNARNEELRDVGSCTDEIDEFFHDSGHRTTRVLHINKWEQEDGMDIVLQQNSLAHFEWIENEDGRDGERILLKFYVESLLIWLAQYKFPPALSQKLEVVRNELESRRDQEKKEASGARKNNCRVTNTLNLQDELQSIEVELRKITPLSVVKEEEVWNQSSEQKGESAGKTQIKKTIRVLVPETETVELSLWKLNQLRYLPKELTHFALHPPYIHGDNMTPSLEKDAATAFKELGKKYTDFSGGNPRRDIDAKARMYVEGPGWLMIRFAARRINPAFIEYVSAIFGQDRFKAAPLKTKQRLFSNIKAELKNSRRRLWDSMGGSTIKSQKEFNQRALGMFSAHQRVVLTTACYETCDIVRGSVSCDGQEDMLDSLKILKSRPVVNGTCFTLMRIKNSHHIDAKSVGGYRDVKVIGVLDVPAGDRTDSMLVEIQLIDKIFLDLKKLMHRPFMIMRGDFGKMPVEAVIHYGQEDEFHSRWDVLTAIVADGATHVGEYAFMACENLQGITLPNSLETINRGAFMNCSSLYLAEFKQGLLSIESEAFCCCISMKELILPDSIQRVGKHAFKENTGLRNATLPTGLEVVGEEAFLGCTSLQDLSVIGNADEDALKEKATSPMARSIHPRCFFGCRNLLLVNLRGAIFYSIGFCAFQLCVSLREVQLNESLVAISEGAFKECRNLRKVLCASNLKRIESQAFKDCKKLESINLPETLDHIGREAFRHCKSLKTIHLHGGIECIEQSVFFLCKSLSLIILPANLKWIAKNAFAYCSKLEHIVLPETLERIEGWAFSFCTKMQSINFPSSLEFVEKTAFREVDSTLFAYEFKEKWRLKGLNVNGKKKRVKSDDVPQKNKFFPAINNK